MSSTEVLNAVSPWMGRIVWVGEPRTGKSKKGNEWKSVDFTLIYTDVQGQEQNITFSMFGSEKVEAIQKAGVGAMVKVLWRPDSHEYNGKWYSKFDAYDVTVMEEKKEEPKRATIFPPSAPAYEPKPEEEKSGDVDLPFSQSPGVRG